MAILKNKKQICNTGRPKNIMTVQGIAEPAEFFKWYVGGINFMFKYNMRVGEGVICGTSCHPLLIL